MAIQFATDSYMIPRGRVYFDPFDAAGVLTGERDLGNCPDVTINIASQKAEHYSSTTGLRQKDKSVVVQVDRTGNLACDNVTLENAAMFFSGSVEAVTQAGGSASNEALEVISGRFYQLGQTTANPAGARHISSVVVEADAAAWAADTAYALGDIVKPTTGTGLHYYRCTVAGTSAAVTEPTWPTDGSTVVDNTVTWEDAGTLIMVAGTDYNTDLVMGRLQILAPVGAVATPIVVDYTKAAAAWERVKTGAVSELSGALRIVSENSSGDDRDFYMPYVNLAPDGDLPVITEGTDFVRLGFTLEVLKPANGEAIYVDGRPA